MPVVALEVQRAQRLLESFCNERNRGASDSGPRLSCRRDGQTLVLLESRRRDRRDATPLLRLSLQRDAWLLSCADSSGRWSAYPHLPQPVSIRRIIEELQQAPLHVHWD